MKNETKYRLINLDDDTMQSFDSVKDLCACIVGEKVGQYYVLESITMHQKKDISHDLAKFKQAQKDKAAEEKAAGKKPDVEVVAVKGEVKDDSDKKVQGNRPRLRQ